MGCDMCIFNKFVSDADAPGPGTTPGAPPLSIHEPYLLLSRQPWARRKQASLYTGCIAPLGPPTPTPGPCPPQPSVVEANQPCLCLSAELAAAQPLLLPHLQATLKLLSPPMHVAFCLLLSSHSLCFFTSISVCQVLTSRLPLARIHRPHPSSCADIYISKAQCVFMIPPTSAKQGFPSQIYSQLDSVVGGG